VQLTLMPKFVANYCLYGTAVLLLRHGSHGSAYVFRAQT